VKPKKCPKCGHPMMDCEGEIQPRRGEGDHRKADWWCADCHHVIWAKDQPAQSQEG
jgi:uncharacterized protein with PIN domain